MNKSTGSQVQYMSHQKYIMIQIIFKTVRAKIIEGSKKTRDIIVLELKN
jgi:hypothetical protein